jgi:excisionase family DNA binding protein
MASETDYLSTGQAARLLGVSPKTVNRWAHEGRIPCIVTLGGHLRIRASLICELIEEMGGSSICSEHVR